MDNMDHMEYGWKNTVRILIPILAYAGITYLAEFVGTIIAMMFSVLAIKQGGGSIEYASMVDMIGQILTDYSYELSIAACVMALPVMLYFMHLDRKRLGDQRKVYDQVPIAYYIPLLILGAAGCLALNNMVNLSGLAGNYQENLYQVQEALYHGRILLELAGIGVLSPVVEEILFRGVVMNRIEETGSTKAAIILSAILFGCYHGNLLQAVYASMLGLILGYVYAKYRRLAAPILVHVGANIISVIGSETIWLDGMYQSDLYVMIFTAIWCVVILLCVYVVQYFVNPVELKKQDSL